MGPFNQEKDILLVWRIAFTVHSPLSSGWALSIKRKTSCAFGGLLVVALQSSSLVSLQSGPRNSPLVISPVSLLKAISQLSPVCIWIFSPLHPSVGSHG